MRQRFQVLGAEDLKQLTDAGMTIGGHTLSHPMLSEQSDELARAEIRDCRLVLQRATGQPVWALAYPFGDPGSVGDREYQFAEDSDYDCAFVNVGGAINAACPRFALPRIHVTAEMSLAVYEAHVSGFHGSLQQRFRKLASG